MKKSVLVIAVVGLLVVVPSALAKELTVTAVCGPSGCNAISPAVKLGHDGMTAPVKAVPMGDYYVVRVGFGDGEKIFERVQMYFVPAAGALAGMEAADPTSSWMGMPEPAAAQARKAAEGLKPYALPAPTKAYIGTHRAVDAAPYVRLLGPLEKTTIPRAAESPIVISLFWTKTNPWSSAGALIQYLPKAGVVIRTDGYYRAPGSIADRARREAAGLPPTVPGGGFPWTLTGGLTGLAAALAAGAGLVAWRCRRAPAPEGAVAT